MKKSKQKLASGGTVKNYMQNPQQVLTENSINLKKAQAEAASDPWITMVKGLGGLLASSGGLLSELGSGDNASTEGLALGGQVQTADVRVDDGEVIETPDGKLAEVKGNPDEIDGVDATLPVGTKVFSDMLMKHGETMAKRKTDREKRLSKISKYLEKNPGDSVLKKSYKRVQEQNAIEEEEDMQFQSMITELTDGLTAQKKGYAGGTGEEGIQPTVTGNPWVDAAFAATNYLNTQPEKEDPANPAIGTSFGNMLGIGGNLYGMIKGQQNTLNSRATDTANNNAYADFGQDALEANDNAKGYARETTDTFLNEIRQNAQASKRSGRIGARGINTQRANDLAVDQGVNDATGKAYAQLANTMMSLFGQQSQLENQQDQAVMAGEDMRDMRDRADKDAYYTNRSQDIANTSLGLQQTGKDLNDIRHQEIIMKLMQQMSKYGVGFDKNFNQIVLPTKNTTGN